MPVVNEVTRQMDMLKARGIRWVLGAGGYDQSGDRRYRGERSSDPWVFCRGHGLRTTEQLRDGSGN